MRHRPLLLSVAAIACATLGAHHALRASDGFRVASVRPQERVTNGRQIIVQFARDASDRDAERDIRMAGGGRARRSAFGSRYLVTLDDGFSMGEAVSRLRQLPEVEYAEANGRMKAFHTPNDRLFPVQWHFRMLNSERTWDIQTGDPSVVVAVVDTGIAYEDFGPFRKAPDFGNTPFVQGFNAFTGTSHANDDNFHGTHVASTIAESTDNATGVAGFAYHCALMPVKVLDSTGEGSFFEVAEGINYAANFTQNGVHPVKVINMSLGGDGSSRAVTDAINLAVRNGITVVAAAGNDGVSTISFPAALPNVIAVGAVDGRKHKTDYSNAGPELDVMAPGGDLDRDDTGTNLAPDGRPDGVLQQTFDPETAEKEGRFDDFAYFFVSGTSQATPHVAALAAMLYKQGITDPVAIKAAIENTADDLGTAGRDDQYGHGLINPVKALSGYGLSR
jgi:serine protease